MNNRKDQSLCNQPSSHLVIIDIQEKLSATMPEKVINRVIKNTALLTQAAAAFDIPVTLTEQYPRGLGPTLSPVATIASRARRIEKTCFSCADSPEFNTICKENRRPQIILVGMEAHVCVLQTAIDLQAAKHHVFVVEDAICSRRLENYENAIHRLQQAGVIVTNAESVVFEWLRDSRHEQFKTISALLR